MVVAWVTPTNLTTRKPVYKPVQVIHPMSDIYGVHCQGFLIIIFSVGFYVPPIFVSKNEVWRDGTIRGT